MAELPVNIPPINQPIQRQQNQEPINLPQYPTLEQIHTQPLQQQTTPHPTHLDSEGNKYDPWPNGWGHKLPTDTTNTVRLFTKNFNSISPPQDKSPNAKLHNAIIDLHTHDAGILAGQEPCIDFKQKGQNQELKYAYMKKFRNSRTTTACSKIPAANDTYLPGGALLTTLGKFSARVIASGSD